MKRILLALLIGMQVFMQQVYAGIGDGRQVLELMFTQDQQSAELISSINVSQVQNGNLQNMGNNHYLIWNNNQQDGLYQVTLHLKKDGYQLIFYLNPFYDSYCGDYGDCGWLFVYPPKYGDSWMLGIWNWQKKSINQSIGSYKFKAYTGRYYINNSLLKHTAVNIYETVYPVVNGNKNENSEFMSEGLPQFKDCNEGGLGDAQCMWNPLDKKWYVMDRVKIAIQDLYVKNAKEYLVGFNSNNNHMITWQQKSEDDYGKDGSTKKPYFQASYNQQPFCKVYMRDDLSSITSVEQTQYASIGCNYEPDDYQPKLIFSCSGSNGLGVGNNNQNVCGWYNIESLQNQAFSSNVNHL